MAAGLLAMDGLLGLEGWQWLFLAEGLPTLAFGVCVSFTPWCSAQNVTRAPTAVCCDVEQVFFQVQNRVVNLSY